MSHLFNMARWYYELPCNLEGLTEFDIRPCNLSWERKEDLRKHDILNITRIRFGIATVNKKILHLRVKDILEVWDHKVLIEWIGLPQEYICRMPRPCVEDGLAQNDGFGIEVERVLKVKKVKGNADYKVLVKWKGFDKRYICWIPKLFVPDHLLL